MIMVNEVMSVKREEICLAPKTVNGSNTENQQDSLSAAIAADPAGNSCSSSWNLNSVNNPTVGNKKFKRTLRLRRVLRFDELNVDPSLNHFPSRRPSGAVPSLSLVRSTNIESVTTGQETENRDEPSAFLTSKFRWRLEGLGSDCVLDDSLPFPVLKWPHPVSGHVPHTMLKGVNGCRSGNQSFEVDRDERKRGCGLLSHHIEGGVKLGSYQVPNHDTNSLVDYNELSPGSVSETPLYPFSLNRTVDLEHVDDYSAKAGHNYERIASLYDASIAPRVLN